MRQYTLPSGATLLSGEFTIGEGADLIRFPANWLDLASADDLAAHGITVSEIPDPPPPPPPPQAFTANQVVQGLQSMGVTDITADQITAAIVGG